MNKCLTILSTKLFRKASKMAGKGGSSTPGSFAKKINKNILKQLKDNVNTIILVSGTNGKTTTSNILASILRSSGYSVIHNQEGSNMLSGIITTFIADQNISGTKKFDYAVLEVDEGSIEKVLDEIDVHYFLFTNLFKDQIDRFGTEKDLSSRLRNSLENKDISLLLNADDPYVANLATRHNTSYYGLDKRALGTTNNENGETFPCPSCESSLDYEYIFYSHLGDYRCDSCGVKRTKEKYRIEKVEDNRGINLTLNGITYQSYLKGQFNAYNLSAAVSMALELGLDHKSIKESLLKLQKNKGRMEVFAFKEKECLLNLAKNTVGVNATLDVIENDLRELDVYFLFNANAPDGTDSSWILDIDLSKLENVNINKIYYGGSEHQQIKTLLDRYPFTENKIEQLNEIDLLSKKIKAGANKSLVIPNYTMLEKVRENIIKN